MKNNFPDLYLYMKTGHSSGKKEHMSLCMLCFVSIQKGSVYTHTHTLYISEKINNKQINVSDCL